LIDAINNLCGDSGKNARDGQNGYCGCHCFAPFFCCPLLLYRVEFFEF
jgi:hypothetical protein